MIACGGWVGGKALGCPAPEVALNVLFEEALSNKFFQVPLEAFAVDGLVFLAFVEGIILFHSEECGVALDWLRASYPQLVFDGAEDFIDGKLQRNEVLFYPEGSEWIQRTENACFLKTVASILALVCVKVSCCEFVFSLPWPCLREWLTKLIASN